MNEINKYFLDLNKIHRLEDKEERQQIHTYYKDMLYAYSENRMNMAESIKWTLINSGYLLDNNQFVREEKLNEILDEN